jgi:hypothetical protein
MLHFSLAFCPYPEFMEHWLHEVSHLGQPVDFVTIQARLKIPM